MGSISDLFKAAEGALLDKPTIYKGRVGFTLMNADEEILEFDYVPESGIDYYYEEVSPIKVMPLSYIDIESFLTRRRAPFSRKNISKLFGKCGVLYLYEYLLLTHAVSLTDTYWVKQRAESITWDEVSPYRNPLSDIIARYAFTGKGYVNGSLVSPEFTTDGSFPKRWVKVNGVTYLEKGGLIEHNYMEPQCEVVASSIYESVLKAGTRVVYSLNKDNMTSMCKLFTNEDVGFMSIADAIDCTNRMRVKDLLELYSTYGNEDLFRRMVIADALTLNVDRHSGNMGFLVDNKSQTIIGMAPAFDYNCSLLYDYTEEDCCIDLNGYIRTKYPKVGNSFISVARYLLTDDIESDIKCIAGISNYENEFPNIKLAGLMGEVIKKQKDMLLGN